MRRSLPLLIVGALALGLTACGNADRPATSSSAPPAAKAKPTDPRTSSDPKRLNEAQSLTATGSAEPPVCELVTADEARTIVGAPVRRPIVAPQGPTCVYRAHVKKGENPREGFVTIAVQHRTLTDARKGMVRQRRTEVGGQAGVCGVSGQPMMYVEAPGDRVLAIVGSCPTAKRFAALALKRLSS